MDTFLAVTGRAAAFDVLRDINAEEASGAAVDRRRRLVESGLLDSVDKTVAAEFDPSTFEPDDKQLTDALSAYTWPHATFESMAWVTAHAMQRLRDRVEDPDAFTELQDALLSSIDDAIGGLLARPDEVQPYCERIAECLIELDIALMDRHSAGSRAIVGTIMLCTQSGVLLKTLDPGRGDVRYGYRDIKRACSAVIEAGRAEYEPGRLDMADAILAVQDMGYRKCGFDTMHPVITLCHPTTHAFAFGEESDWFVADAPCPFSDVMVRDDANLLRRPSKPACDKILAEIRTDD